MRTLAPFTAAIVLTACGAEPGLPNPKPHDPPPEVTPASHELKLPASVASSQEVIVYAKREGAKASYETELHYALAGGYPSQVTLAPEGGYVISQGCKLRLGTVVWKSIADVQGTAAKVALDGGKLAIDLLEEGDVSLLLEGEVTGQECTPESGPPETSIPLQHRVVLHTHHVAGFVVEQFNQVLSDCWGAMVLPSGAPVSVPTAAPLAADGARFDAANAPAPVAITLRSPGALTLLDSGRFSAEAGTVSLSLDTKLPVEGLQSFEVVGPDALTAVDAELYLSKAASKGSITEAIDEGMSYSIFFPEERNQVVIRATSAMTALGKLCDNVPGEWFSSTSSTPEKCAAVAGVTDPFSTSYIPVASILAPGECRVEVTIPKTTHGWTTSFITTF